MSAGGGRWSSGPMELRCGDWRERLADVSGDALCTDPPYSERVVLGYRSGSDPTLDRGVYNIPYAAWKESDAIDLARWAAERIRFWAIVFNDHVGARWLESAFREVGWYVFAPIPWCRTDPPPRVNGDGPCSATEWITIARPRRKQGSDRMGSRPGFYVYAGTSAARYGEQPVVTGQKPLDLMRILLRDYSLPGDMIVEPFCGGGTTLLAAAIEGRKAIGAEVDPSTYAKAVDRLSAGYTPAFGFAQRSC